MTDIACTCDDGFGFSHSHIYKSGLGPGDYIALRVDTGEIRVWVDWPALAKQLITDTFYVVGCADAHCLHGPHDFATAQATARDHLARVVKVTGVAHSPSLVGR